MSNIKLIMDNNRVNLVYLPLLIWIDYYYLLPLVWIAFIKFNKFVKWPHLPLRENSSESKKKKNRIIDDPSLV